MGGDQLNMCIYFWFPPKNKTEKNYKKPQSVCGPCQPPAESGRGNSHVCSHVCRKAAVAPEPTCFLGHMPMGDPWLEGPSSSSTG